MGLLEDVLLSYGGGNSQQLTSKHSYTLCSDIGLVCEPSNSMNIYDNRKEAMDEDFLY